MNQHSEKELLDALRAARSAYMSLSTEYDSMLFHAHSYGHGSTEMLEALRKATRLAPKVQEALRHYFETVQRLAKFYQEKRHIAEG